MRGALLLMVIVGPVLGNDEFERGVEARDRPALARQHFARAADRLASHGSQTPEHYLNLAKARYLADELPEAILACRVGLALRPGDRELRRQLAWLRQQLRGPDLIFESPSGFPGMPHAGWLVLVFTVAYVAGWMIQGAVKIEAFVISFRAGSVSDGPSKIVAHASGSELRRRMAARLQNTSRLSWICFLIAAATGGMWLWQHAIRTEETRSPLAVVRADTRLLQGNGPSFGVVRALPRGQELRVQLQRGDWVQVRHPQGAVGWLPREALAVHAKPQG